MNKKMSRYKGLILSCVSVMLIVVCVCSFSFESKASNLEIVVNHAKPSTSDTQGYITVFRYDEPNNSYNAHTYFWNMYCAKDGSGKLPIYMQVEISPYEIVFRPAGDTDYIQVGDYYYNLYEVTPQGYYRIRMSTGTERYTANLSTKPVHGWQCGGNVYVVDDVGYWNNFTVYYSETASDLLMQDVLEMLQTINTQSHLDSHNIWMELVSILDSVDGVENQLSSVINYLKSIDDELVGIKDELEKIYAKADEILEEEKKQTTWLEKIWNSIQEFLNPDEEDKEESDKLQSESNDKTDKLDDLNEQNKTDKTDIDDASNSVDENVDLESIDNYGKVLATITENQYILQILLLVFSVALVAYVLFGKK